MKLERPSWRNVRVTQKHWHFAAIAALCLLNLFLGVRVLLAWNRAHAGDAARLERHEAEYKAMMLKTRPLRGLDKKIVQAKQDQAAFYSQRFPATYSEVATELGALAVKEHVLLTRVQYAQGPLDQGVYQVRMDASLTGDYVPIVRFINGLERDKLFFMINGIALNGQQSGVVSLRMRLTTYLRAQPGATAAADQTTEQR